jgi:hypothetical protein
LLSKSGPDGAAASLEHAVQCVRLQLQRRCPPSALLIFFPGIRFQPSQFELPAPPRHPSYLPSSFHGKTISGRLLSRSAPRSLLCFRHRKVFVSPPPPPAEWIRLMEDDSQQVEYKLEPLRRDSGSCSRWRLSLCATQFALLSPSESLRLPTAAPRRVDTTYGGRRSAGRIQAGTPKTGFRKL